MKFWLRISEKKCIILILVKILSNFVLLTFCLALKQIEKNAFESSCFVRFCLDNSNQHWILMTEEMNDGKTLSQSEPINILTG